MIAPGQEPGARNDRREHWDGFYRSTDWRGLKPPSQFGAFVIGELTESTLLVDVGCGSGRDALFFASQGVEVVGVDASAVAIAHCSQAAEQARLPASFVCASVEDTKLAAQLRATAGYGRAEALLVYARFFLHAIPEPAEDAFLDLVAALAKPGRTRLAVEFRTQRDATLPKTTAQHYRRFIAPVDLLQKASRRGLRVDYLVEGFGFAKRGDDDAHVARCLFSL